MEGLVAPNAFTYSDFCIMIPLIRSATHNTLSPNSEMPNIGPDYAISPSEWGAQIDYDEWDDEYTPDEAIALHHGGGGDYPAHHEPYDVGKEMEQLRAWESFHLSRGWRGIAYGWAVGQSGTVYRLRGWNGYAAHAGDVDADHISNNQEIIPILFIGSGSRVGFSPQAEFSFRQLRAWLEVEVGRGLFLFGHRELGSTSCPGDILFDYVKQNRVLEDTMVLSEHEVNTLKEMHQAWVESKTGSVKKETLRMILQSRQGDVDKHARSLAHKALDKLKAIKEAL